MSEMTTDEKAELYRQIASINANMSRVLMILESDHKTNATGLVEDVRILRKELDEIKVDRKVFNGRMATYAAIGTFLGWAVGWVVKLVMEK